MKHLQTFESFLNESKEKWKVAYAGKGFYGITNGGKIEGEYSKEEAERLADEKNNESVSEARTYGLFNDAQGKPSKLSQEILDFCQKGLPKDVVNNISEVEAAGYFKTNMITPPTVSNKGQSRGEADYTSIYIHFTNPMGKNKIKGMTVGLRKRTSGPGTGYVAIALDGVPGGTFAAEFYNKPEDVLEKLWNENVKPLL